MLFFTRSEKVVIGVCLIVLCLCGVTWVMRSTRAAVNPVQPFFSESPLASVKSPETVTVHVAGRVRHPGVYELPLNSRVLDAVRLAGGGLPKADLDSLNLAKVLEDGERVYVPDPSERYLLAERGPGMDHTSTKKAADLPQHSISLNKAGQQELQKLPGVGPAMSGRIIEYRKAHSGFKSVDELMNVRGIGPKKFARIRNLVRV